MKWIKLFEEYRGKNICKKCDHSWEIDKKDKNPNLCHTCGYDLEMKDYNPEELEKFWGNYRINKLQK